MMLDTRYYSSISATENWRMKIWEKVEVLIISPYQLSLTEWINSSLSKAGGSAENEDA